MITGVVKSRWPRCLLSVGYNTARYRRSFHRALPRWANASASADDLTPTATHATDTTTTTTPPTKRERAPRRRPRSVKPKSSTLSFESPITAAVLADKRTIIDTTADEIIDDLVVTATGGGSTAVDFDVSTVVTFISAYLPGTGGIDGLSKTIRVYDVREDSIFSDYIVCAVCSSARQMSALATGLYKLARHSRDAARRNRNLLSIEGRNSDEWTTVDCGQVMVHLFNRNAAATANAVGLEYYPTADDDLDVTGGVDGDGERGDTSNMVDVAFADKTIPTPMSDPPHDETADADAVAEGNNSDNDSNTYTDMDIMAQSVPATLVTSRNATTDSQHDDDDDDDDWAFHPALKQIRHTFAHCRINPHTLVHQTHTKPSSEQTRELKDDDDDVVDDADSDNDDVKSDMREDKTDLERLTDRRVTQPS